MNIEQWLNDDELGLKIWRDKYQQGEENFEEWLDRISNGNEKIRQLILEKKFLFGGRILASRNLKDDRKVTYSNCYVLPQVEDNIESIYDTAKYLARTFSYGGGCGIDISNLRPKGSPVNNSAKTTSGAVSFMDTFSQVSTVIGQEGRRGALMISMSVHHPDVEEFIDAKKNTDKLEGCNISVRVDDAFMNKAKEPNSKEARIFRKLCENNWDYAEPGILYWDNINKYNMLTEYIQHDEFEYAGVNPCAEEPLPAGGSCLLGAINLAEFVNNPHGERPTFNVIEFSEAVKEAVIALNEVLDEGLDLHPLDIQKECVRAWRQIGLGIMGFADMLIKMKITYGSERCLKLIDIIGKALVTQGLITSCNLAEEYGAFDNCDSDFILNSTFIQNHPLSVSLKQKIDEYGLRNSQLFTIAPTGSISTMIGVSGGLEPIFDYHFTRATKSLGDKEQEHEVLVPVIMDAMKGHSWDNVPDYVTWSSILDPLDRVKVQSAWQQHIDASISSTVNLPHETSIDMICALYMSAWEQKCKGLTIYRAGCARQGILVSKEEKKEEPIKVYDNDISIDNCVAQGTKLITGCGSLWLTCYFHKQDGRLCHIFLNKGSEGGCNSYMIGLSRMISLAGRKGATIDEIIDQLNSVQTCPSYNNRKRERGDTSKGNCCPSAIGNAIKMLHDRFMNLENTNRLEIDLTKKQEPKQEPKKGNCPQCGAEMAMSGGCNICLHCGYSKCD